jgi:hypothetical protein
MMTAAAEAWTVIAAAEAWTVIAAAEAWTVTAVVRTELRFDLRIRTVEEALVVMKEEEKVECM